MLRAWGAGEVCMHPRLLSHLCDPKSETSRQGCEFRYSSLQVKAVLLAMCVSNCHSDDVHTGTPNAHVQAESICTFIAI